MHNVLFEAKGYRDVHWCTRYNARTELTRPAK